MTIKSGSTVAIIYLAQLGPRRVVLVPFGSKFD